MNAAREETQSQNCSECNSTGDRWLHDVRHRGIYRRLCAGCVLKLHSSFFCPVCLEVYADGFPPENTIKCSECPSLVHAACISPESIVNRVCLCCKGFTFLRPLHERNLQRRYGAKPVIDLPRARIMVAAAQIASISMARAASAAWVDADIKIRESVLAKKRARGALLLISQRAEVDNSFTLEDQAKSFGIKSEGIATEEKEQHPNGNAAKKQAINGREDDRLMAFTNSLLVQHRNVQNKVKEETNWRRPSGHPVVSE